MDECNIVQCQSTDKGTVLSRESYIQYMKYTTKREYKEMDRNYNMQDTINCFLEQSQTTNLCSQ